jgi:hypothetical protein
MPGLDLSNFFLNFFSSPCTFYWRQFVVWSDVDQLSWNWKQGYKIGRSFAYWANAYILWAVFK